MSTPAQLDNNATGRPTLAGRRSQPQRIHLVSMSRDGVDSPTRAVATGPILGHGTAAYVVDRVTEEGLLGHFNLQLGEGTVSGTFVQRTFQLNFDPQACVARPTAAGAMDITGGTGSTPARAARSSTPDVASSWEPAARAASASAGALHQRWWRCESRRSGRDRSQVDTSGAKARRPGNHLSAGVLRTRAAHIELKLACGWQSEKPTRDGGETSFEAHRRHPHPTCRLAPRPPQSLTGSRRTSGISRVARCWYCS